MRVDKFARRRLVVFTPLLVTIALVVGWAIRLATEPPRYSCDTPSVSVERGDTLYGIAHRHCTGDVSAVVDSLVRKYGTALDVWQTIELPLTSEAGDTAPLGRVDNFLQACPLCGMVLVSTYTGADTMDTTSDNQTTKVVAVIALRATRPQPASEVDYAETLRAMPTPPTYVDPATGFITWD